MDAAGLDSLYLEGSQEIACRLYPLRPASTKPQPALFINIAQITRSIPGSMIVCHDDLIRCRR